MVLKSQFVTLYRDAANYTEELLKSQNATLKEERNTAWKQKYK